jgi:hypothetical protein
MDVIDIKDITIPSYSQLAVLLGWPQRQRKSPNNKWEETACDLSLQYGRATSFDMCLTFTTLSLHVQS